MAALCLCVLSQCGCSGGEAQAAPEERSPGPAPAEPLAKERRPSEPRVLLPQAPGERVLGAGALTVDYSNCAQGYVMARYNGSAAKANIQLTGPDGVTYKYFLPPSEAYEALPLSGGSGSYRVDGYENIEGSSYATLFKETVEVSLENDLLPFLYPNMFVKFTEQSEAVSKARELVAEAENDLEAVALLYHYVVENVSYDTHKAETVTSGYLPVVDETLRTGKGICFDYAALTCAMLRSQGIPARLEIGYAGKVYHAWISVYTEETGWIDKLIEFTGDAWTRMDPTFASGNGSSSSILKYIGDGSNYNLQYSR